MRNFSSFSIYRQLDVVPVYSYCLLFIAQGLEYDKKITKQISNLLGIISFPHCSFYESMTVFMPCLHFTLSENVDAMTNVYECT